MSSGDTKVLLCTLWLFPSGFLLAMTGTIA